MLKHKYDIEIFRSKRINKFQITRISAIRNRRSFSIFRRSQMNYLAPSGNPIIQGS